MQTKPLYILVADNGDGSNSLRYFFDTELLEHLEELYSSGQLEYGFPGIDGDGLNCRVLNVPVECTAESLGITSLFTRADIEEYM